MPLFSGKSDLITGKQAQQGHRFVLNIKGVDAAIISKVNSPSYKVTPQSYTMLDYKFNYPTMPEWNNEISFDIIQIIDEELVTSTIGYFMSKFYNSAYFASPMGVGTGERDLILPNSLYNVRSKISEFFNNGLDTGYSRTADEGTILEFSKQKLVAALGTVQILLLDEQGKTFESWRLNGAFISSISPSDLSYEDEKLSRVTVKISYDWADYGFRGVYAEEDVVSRIGGIF